MSFRDGCQRYGICWACDRATMNDWVEGRLSGKRRAEEVLIPNDIMMLDLKINTNDNFFKINKGNYLSSARYRHATHFRKDAQLSFEEI